jgi:hypothetical protein
MHSNLNRRPDQTDLRTSLDLPKIDQCYVVRLTGIARCSDSLHQMVSQLMMPYSHTFVSALIESVQLQQDVPNEILENEERFVRSAVMEKGEEHGQSGFTNRVVWLTRSTDYISCEPNLGPLDQNSTFATIHSYSLLDPRAYRSTTLTLVPDICGGNSIPAYSFDMQSNGTLLWNKVAEVVPALCQIMDLGWQAFSRVEAFGVRSTFNGCYLAETADDMQLILRPST